MGNHAVLFILLLCCLLCSVQEGDDLGAGAGVVGREAAVTCAVGYAVCDCPVDGIIIVTSPQEPVSMIVAKAVNIAKLMNNSGARYRREHELLQMPRLRQGARDIQREQGRCRCKRYTF